MIEYGLTTPTDFNKELDNLKSYIDYIADEMIEQYKLSYYRRLIPFETKIGIDSKITELRSKSMGLYRRSGRTYSMFKLLYLYDLLNQGHPDEKLPILLSCANQNH